MMGESLCEPCAIHFAAVRSHLDALEVPYRIEPTLVRGLDYYSRTAFEYYRQGAEGQQQALGGGGRYDGLVELLGGRPTPGIGFALGLDRVLLALEETGAAEARQVAPLAVIVGADPADTTTRLKIASMLRAEGLSVRAELSPRKLGRQLESASREHAHFAVIIGDELADGHVQLKDLEAGTQHLVPLDALAKDLARAAKSHHHG
jgi:histidyl-tRNA synthetase